MVVAEPLLLWNARVLDGRGSGPAERRAVQLRDGRIAEIGVAEGEPPEGALDLEGRTLMPGLVDAHLHVYSHTDRSPGFGPCLPKAGEEPRPDELGFFVLANTARALLDAGITTVRDVGAYDCEAIVLRRGIELGLVEGPRILSCGKIISATSAGGRLFGTMYREADGPDEVRKAVREQLRAGADFIKVMATGARSVERENPEPAQLTREELGAIVDEAHRLGIRVAAHAEGLSGTRVALDAGVDTIEHGLALHRAPELLASMAERGTVLVPTLTTFHDLAERFADLFAPVLVEQAKRQLEEAYLTLTAARAAGVTIAMGYDSGPPGSSAIELGRMVDGGLPSLEALVTAGLGSARALGLEDEIGTVEPGKVADILVVDGYPAEDVRVLLDRERIWLVLKDGHAVSGTTARTRQRLSCRLP